MEVRGTPGGEAWIKAIVKAIQIRETGTSYFVQLEGRDEWHEVDAADIIFETDAAAMLAETSRRLEDIKEDLSRRDFAMNAIAINLSNGEIIDPFGGKSDIENRIIRLESVVLGNNWGNWRTFNNQQMPNDDTREYTTGNYIL